MILDFFLLAVGLGLLVVGGDILIRGSVAIAERMNIPPLIVGLTIVSFGTSAPELFISVDAALLGLGGLAVGNVVGSNIANILLVLGLPAIFATTPCSGAAIGRNMIIMIGFTIVFMAMLYFGPLMWYHGAILISLLAVFLFDQYNAAVSGGSSVLIEENATEAIVRDPKWKSVLYLIGGLSILPIAAHLTVTGAREIASGFGISDAVIGLTVVAIGTSLPELAASLMAVIRGSTSVAIGNVVGSNIFNIAAIMGITSLVTPVEPGDHIVNIDMWIMLAASILIALIARFLKEISFKTGFVMTLTYATYLVVALFN